MYLRKLSHFIILSFLLLSSAKAQGWKGQWIEAPQCQERPNTWQRFTHDFTLSTKPTSLKARIAVDSKYWLWLNNRLIIFEGQLKRGPSPTSTYYDIVELAPYLRKGANHLQILTCYFGKDGFSHISSGHAGLLFDAQNNSVDILSDSSWHAEVLDAYTTCDTETPNYRLSEASIRFDARHAGTIINGLPGGNAPTQRAKVIASQAINSIYGNLVSRPIPFWRFTSRKKYIWTKWDSVKRQLRCRLPYDAQVTPYLKVKAKAGKTIDMRTEDFKIGTQNSVRAEYITREGIQEYESLGWINGNEMIYTIPPGVKVIDGRYRESGYDTDIVGEFNCNDPFWNELWKRSARTLYVNMRDTYFDCPDRERAQWWGDVVNDIQENFYVLSTTSWKIIDKGMRELIAWQNPDGVIHAPIPGNYKQELPCQMLMSVGWYGFYTHWYNSGNFSSLADLYNGIHKYLHQVWQTDSNGFVPIRKGGWSWADWGSNIDLELITNEWYYLALKAEQEYARILGKSEDQANIARQIDKMVQGFDKRYWQGNGYKSPNFEGQYDDRAQALAVVSGLASKERYPYLFKIFETTHFSSPLLELYVQEALFRMGKGKEALARARHLYSKMMSNPNATTVYELWEPGASINHAWASGMTVILGREVCGIKPTSLGFKTFDIAPQLAGLTHVKTQVQIKYGTISVDLSLQKSGHLKAQVVVPRGTTATVKWNGKQLQLHGGRHSVKL